MNGLAGALLIMSLLVPLAYQAGQESVLHRLREKIREDQ